MSADRAEQGAIGLPAEYTITVVGFGRRLLATVIDSLLVGAFSILGGVGAGVVGLVVGMYSPDATEIADRFVLVFGLLFSIVYYVAFWAKSGQTVGNTVTMIKVVRSDGSPLGWGRAVLRFVGYLLSAIVLSIGFLWVAFDSRRQGWHDKIARTYVIRSDEDFSAADSVTFVPSDPQRSWGWIVVWVVAAVLAPGLLSAGLWTLGPFVTKLVTALLGAR